MKDPIKVKQGKKARRDGGIFELRVRKDLESKGYIVNRWSNNVDLENNKLVKAKSNRFNMRTCGFPDFACHTLVIDKMSAIFGVEVKMNGILSKIEKEKIQWLLKNKIFGAIYLAEKGIGKQIIYSKIELKGGKEK